MAFYTGDALPQWKGDLFVGALAGQHLRRLVIEGGRIVKQERLLTGLESRIRDVRDGPDGYLYLLTDGPEGQLIRLERKR
jgi:glucose/arabinose dehydrogenase